MILAFAAAAALTIATGQTWAFSIERGRVANAHRVVASARPTQDEIVVAVRPLMGTTMIVTNGSKISYTYRAELIGAGVTVLPKLCNLPRGGQPVFESWPQKARAVRLSHFAPASSAGNCP